MKRLIVLLAFAALAACAGFEPAGRSAQSGAAPPPPRVAAEPAPVTPAPTPAPQPLPAAPAATPSVAAPGVAAPPPPAPPRAANNNEVIVPGVRERQVPPPHGDPRTDAERIADIRAWDQCVTRVQDRAAADPTRAALDAPEDYCRRTLGMANRTAVPQSREQR